MKFGLSPLQAGGDFDETIQECERAQAAGFDSVWLGEHHGNPSLYPVPLLGLAAIASRTRRVRLGTRRPPQLGQNPRPLQENGTRRANAHLPHRSRAKPRSSTPHARKPATA